MNYQSPFNQKEDELERRLFAIGIIVFLTLFTILYLIRIYYP